MRHGTVKPVTDPGGPELGLMRPLGLHWDNSQKEPLSENLLCIKPFTFVLFYSYLQV